MSGQTVDIAVFATDVESSPVEYDGHVVELDVVDMSENEFRDLFYASNNNEIFALNCSHTGSKTEITFNEQTYSDGSFNLLNEILMKYSEDLGVQRECFEPCSLIEIQKQISCIDTLCDICDVKCSLKWSEVETSLLALGADLSAGTIHTLRVNALFTNSNPNIKDIMVRFNYNVEWA